MKKSVEMYAPSHKTKQSGDEEAIGFFCIKIDFEPVWGKPKMLNGMPNPFRSDSLQDAIAWAEQEIGMGARVEFEVVSRAQHGIPVAWSATVRGKIVDILYIGAFQYPAGHLVDPLIVGTDAENFHGTVN